MLTIEPETVLTSRRRSNLCVTEGDTTLILDPARGGRIDSLRVSGLELFWNGDLPGLPPAIVGGCYPMAPWAGRVRNGLFTFQGETVQLPRTLAGHAIHGLGYDTAWRVDAPNALSVDLSGRWPFGGTLRQTFHLTANNLTVTLELTAGDRAMPFVLGFHPWFPRRLSRGGPVRLMPAVMYQYQTDDEGLPTGRLTRPSPGPWDDCFTAAGRDHCLEWPEALTLTLTSSATHLVVFDKLDGAVCVEPQTAPPDAFNLGPAGLLPARQSAAVSMDLYWRIQ